MQNHNNDTIKTSNTVLRKIYLSLYLKGLCVRGSWRRNRTAIYWPPLYWPWLRFFPVLLSCLPGGLGAQPLWVLVFSTATYLQLVWSPTHLLPNWLNFLCTELYNSSTSTFVLWASQIALIQPIHGQGYTLLFLDRVHLLFTQVHFLFWQPGRVVGQYTTYPVDWGCLIRRLHLCNECPGYGTKLSDEAPVLELWEMLSTPSLSFLTGPLGPRVIIPVRVLYMGEIEIFNDLLYLKPLNCVQTWLILTSII